MAWVMGYLPTGGAVVLVIPPVTITHCIGLLTLIAGAMDHTANIEPLLVTIIVSIVATLLIVIMTQTPGIRNRHSIGLADTKSRQLGVNVFPHILSVVRSVHELIIQLIDLLAVNKDT